MKALKYFEEAGGIGGEVTIITVTDNREEKWETNIDGNIIYIPNIIKRNINGFELRVYSRKGKEPIIVQRDISENMGDYHRNFQTDEKLFGEVAKIRINIARKGRYTRLIWHDKNPNRLDIWYLEKNGIILYQIGIVTHDNGKTFRLLCEKIWEGQLYQNGEGIVGKPAESYFGSFDCRKQILHLPQLKNRLQKINLPKWDGTNEELCPSLDRIPSGMARVQWFNVFGAQGIVILSDGTSVWCHGNNIIDPPGPDGIKRLRRNDLLTFSRICPFGKSQKLLGVRKV